MGQSRGDLQPVCGSIKHGFIMQTNWELVGEGKHLAVAYDNGVEFDRATFTVGSTGEEFITDVTRQVVIEDFPAPGERTVLEWNESTQHFEILAVIQDPVAGEYNLPYWRQLSVDLSEGTYRTAAFLYDEEPDPDTCQPGRLSQAAKDRALETMNQIRALHGLEPVQYSARYDPQMQAAALIQAAAGFPGHYPEPSAQCYTEAGAEGSRANLHGGAGNVDPAAHMISWTNDARNRSLVAGVGHRRWMLNPFAAYVSYGQVLGNSTQKVFGFNAEPAPPPRIAVDYVAFPYEIYPYNLLRGEPPWSFSVIEDKSDLWRNQYPYFENAIISVVRVSDDASLVITDRYTDIQGAGVPNVLSWNVEGWEYDTLYEVEINNVAMRSGVTQNYSYPVLIDRTNIEY